MGTEIEAVARIAPADPRGPRSPDRSSASRPSGPLVPESPVPAPRLSGDVGLVFEVGWDIKDLIIKIVDRQSDRVLRQIPPEEMQKIRAAMRELVGLLLDRRG